MLADLLIESYEPDFEEFLGEGADGDARQGVRRPPPSDRLFASGDNNDLSGIRRSTLSRSGLELGSSAADSGRDPPEAQPKRVAADETAVKSNGEWSWLYAAIDIETKLILDVALFRRYGTDPAAAFLHRLTEKHDLSDAEFLVDQFGYRTVIARLGLSGRVNYTDRNLIKSGFTPSKCVSTASIIRGWAVGRASASVFNSLCITTTIRDRIKLSMERRRSRRYRTRQCLHMLNI